MTLSRREIFKNIWSKLTVAAGMGVFLTAGHALLKRRKNTYPPVRKKRDKLDFAYVPAGLDRLIRPPGAVDEKDFVAGCIRCYRCQDACEQGAIQFFSDKDGRYAHTPYIDPQKKGCNLCMKCTKICPTGVLKPLEIEEKNTVNMGSVELNKDICLSHRAKRIRDEQALLMELGREATDTTAPYQRRGPCGECYMFCQLKKHAIRLEPGAFLAPEIFPDDCVGCGMCEEICRVMVRGEPAIRVVSNRKTA